jgi:hypothetical protein
MKTRLLSDASGVRTFALVVASGAAVMQGLQTFAEGEAVRARDRARPRCR